MLPSFQAFGLTIPMYGVMSALGMLAAFILLGFTRKHTRFSEDQALSAALWAIIMGFLGAKVLYWLVEIKQIIADPAYLLHTLREGFVFYGALIGGLGGVAIYALRKKLPFFSLTDYFIPGLVIGHAFGRIGCFFAGCCYGMECETPISVVFPTGGAAPAGIPLLPTQLMESAFLFLLCAFLVWRLTKKKPFGTVSGWYMVLYGALIGGLGGVAIYALRKKLPFFSLTDYFIPGLVIGHAFGRIGCFFAGCCYGMECETPISVVFPTGGAAPAGIPLLPTQLMESAFLFLLCAFLVWRLTKKKPFGTVSGWYMVLYGVWRFTIEFFRSDERGFVGALSTSQFISIFIFAGGLALLLLVKFGVLKKTVLDLPIPVEEEPKKKKDKAEASEEPVKPEEEAKPEDKPEEPKPEEKE